MGNSEYIEISYWCLHVRRASYRYDVLAFVVNQKPGGVGIFDETRQDAPAYHSNSLNVPGILIGMFSG